MRRKGWIVCSENGQSWMVINDSGSFFLVVHVISLIMICVMTKTLFSTVALKVNLIPDKKKDINEEKEEKEH